MSSSTLLATVIAEEKGTVRGLCPCAAERSGAGKRVQEAAVPLSSTVQPQFTCGVVGGDHKVLLPSGPA